jgi:hypothetical protein
MTFTALFNPNKSRHTLNSNASPYVEHPNLSEPRVQYAFTVRTYQRDQTQEPAIVEASTRGRASLVAILNSKEFVTLREAAQLSGIAEQDVLSREEHRGLFALAVPESHPKYPAWQFSTAWGTGVLATLLHAMANKSGLEIYRFFTTPNPRLTRSGALAHPEVGPPSPLQLLGVSVDGTEDSIPKPLENAAVLTVLNLAQAFAAEGMDVA